MFAIGGLLAVAAAVAPRPAHAADDPPGRVGRITDSQGQAWHYDPQGGDWLQLQRNRPVVAGDRLAVDVGGRVELRIGSTVVRLDGGSEIEIARLDDERIELQLANGTAALRVRSPEVAREVAISTVEGRFMPRRAGHYRIERRDDASTASSWHGELRFEAPDSVLTIAAGRGAELWQQGPQRVTHYSWVEPPSDAFGDWALRADRDDDRAPATRYVSPEMTGWEDLDRHGRWDDHPEYGAIWTPTVVATDWAPYRYGHWAWISPWGWTWVDDAPWGFAPFHYGRWVVYGGRWCWAPGRWVARPVYAPALVAWVGGPAVNVNVTVGAPPVVGWVPLAPRDVYRPTYPARVSAVYLRGINAGHSQWHPPPRTVPTGPIMYTNQGVPGAVTVVASNVLTSRQPVAPAVAQVDSGLRHQLANQPVQRPFVPPAPPPRVVAVPGGAVPVAPPGARPIPPSGATPPPGTGRVGAPGPGAAPTPPQPTPPQVVDVRRDRERIPQRPNLPSQPPAQQQQPTAPSGSAMPPQPAVPGQAAQQPPRPVPPAAVPPPRDRRGDEPGGRRDFNAGRGQPPVRVEPPRIGEPPRSYEPPARPQPPHAAATPRPAAPPTPPAAREMPPPGAAREVQRPPTVREVHRPQPERERVPPQAQPRGEQDGRGRGGERGPRSQFQ